MKRSILIILAVFAINLIIQMRCELFCYDDPYSYWNAILNNGSELTAIPGAPIYILFDLGTKLIHNEVLSIKIIAATLSTLFFILMWIILKDRVRYALFFTLTATFSFWWLELSMQLFKNELGMLFLLFAIFFTDGTLLVFPALIHASTGIFAGMIAISKPDILKNRHLITLTLLLLIVLEIRTLSGSSFTAKYGLGALIETLFYLAMFPIACNSEKDDMRVYIFITALGSILFILMGMIDWAWRFPLTGMPFIWIAFAEGFEKARTDKNRIIFTLGLWVLMISILSAILLLFVSNSLYTNANLETAKQIKELNPPAIFLNDSAAEFNYILNIVGYNKSIEYSNCTGPGIYVSKINQTIEYVNCR